MLHFAPDRGDSRHAALLDRLRFCAMRLCARAERLLMLRDSSVDMMTGEPGGSKRIIEVFGEKSDTQK